MFGQGGMQTSPQTTNDSIRCKLRAIAFDGFAFKVTTYCILSV